MAQAASVGGGRVTNSRSAHLEQDVAADGTPPLGRTNNPCEDAGDVLRGVRYAQSGGGGHRNVGTQHANRAAGH